jgi:hypothetical protein
LDPNKFYQSGADTSVSVNGVYGPAGNNYAGGTAANGRIYGTFRFQIPADIPAGSMINTTYLKMLALSQDDNWNPSSSALRIYMEDSPSSAAPPISNTNYPGTIPNGIKLLTTYQRWPAAGGLTWPVASPVSSTDFKSVLQALVDKYGGLRAGDYIQVLVANDLANVDGRVYWQDTAANAYIPKIIYDFTPPTSGAATHWAITGPIMGTIGVTSRCIGPFKVISEDASNYAVNLGSLTSVILTGTGSMYFSSDPYCAGATSTGTISVAAGTNNQIFYFKNMASQTGDIVASDGVLTNGTLSVTTNIKNCTWIGGGGNSNIDTVANWSLCSG